MKLMELVHPVLDSIEAAGLDFMMVGAIAAGAYGVPRATRDLDFVVEFKSPAVLSDLILRLEPILEFEPQAVFDTLTWGTRHVGSTRSEPLLKVEFFELYDDQFVQSEFGRRHELYLPVLKRKTWIPTAEDVLVQKLRWGRSKDLNDVRDILAVQGTEILDMPYLENWCAEHGTGDRLQAALDSIPPI